MNKLRVRLIISHILPLLILAPVLGFTLLYLWGNYYFPNDLAGALVVQARIIADFARTDPAIWDSPPEAKQFISRIEADVPPRLMLLNNQGQLIYSSVKTDEPRTGQTLTFLVVPSSVQQRLDWSVTYNSTFSQRVVDVAVPIVDSHSKIVGIVRLSYSLADVEQRLIPLRWLVFTAATLASLTALLLGVVLARSISKPLTSLARAVSQITPEVPPKRLPMAGPEEVRMLAANFYQVTQRFYELEMGRRELLAGIVHELGNSLGAMKVTAEAFQKGAFNDPILSAELSHGMKIEIDQLTLLLDDLALNGTSDAAGILLHKLPIQVGELFEAQCHSLAYLVKQKNITLTYELPREEIWINADPERFCQIFSNLVTNAYKYTSVGGRIHVSLEKCLLDDHFWAVVKVTDTGVGIPLSEQKKIFSLFYRSPQTRGMDRGLGIGLALSRQLAEAHSGSLTVESSPGNGTTFILQLPIEEGIEN